MKVFGCCYLFTCSKLRRRWDQRQDEESIQPGNHPRWIYLYKPGIKKYEVTWINKNKKDGTQIARQ